MKLIRIHALALVVVTTTLPAISETWGCHERFVESHPHPIELVSNLENKTGSIEIQGLPVIPTRFRIEGFSRAWRWHDDGAKEGYAFVIQPDDYGFYDGLYYVFLEDKITQPRKTGVNFILR